jgi:hypothetical protein
MNHIRFDKHGPLDAYDNVLHPATMAALKRGLEKYGALWQNHYRADWTALENAQHTIEIHVQGRILDALECLDYGDVTGFEEKLGSVVGYLANAICKVRYHQREDADAEDHSEHTN